MLDPIYPKQFAADLEFEEYLTRCTFLKKGGSRKVYCTCDGKFVVKVALSDDMAACNWIEVATYFWGQDKYPLAEVFSWSATGRYLVMERLRIVETVPNRFFSQFWWLTDLSKAGVVGQPEVYKIFDYALPKEPAPKSHFE